MKRACLFCLVASLAFTIGGFAGEEAPDTNKPPKGFTALFNGKDLAGWKATGKMEVWGTEKDVLYVQGGGGGWLMTDKEYGDFELRLEYKMPKRGNSGVGIRAPLKGDPAYAGMEIQLIDEANWEGKLRPVQHSGAIYDVVPPRKIVSKPIGEWNEMRIVAKGRKITIELNGTTLLDADLDDHKDRFKQHPGLERKAGHIGLQSYNLRVEFRNIFVKTLE